MTDEYRYQCEQCGTGIDQAAGVETYIGYRSEIVVLYFCGDCYE